MRHLLLGLTLLGADIAASRSPNREELLAADRALARSTEIVGVIDGFVSAFTDSAAYLHPGAPLLRGRETIRAFLKAEPPETSFSWMPAFADVSADGLLGYTYGWTRSEAKQGKYLACWRKKPGGVWRIAAYGRTGPIAPAEARPPSPHEMAPAPGARGQPDQRELMTADSAFAALSVARGAKTAFLEFSASDAVAFGASAHFTEGRDAIGAEFDRFPADAVLDWKPVAAEIAPSGDLGCTVGEASIASRQRYSKYLTIWKRQGDGSWKFVADGGNARPAPSASGTPPPED